jgi:8-oxo-dGTP pyrophosphatase MutT (NUDIX family)
MNLKKDLILYLQKYPNEELIITKCLDLLQKTDINVFDRKTFSPGHFTTSSILLSPDCNEVLLTHHKFLNKWLQLGGHFESDDSLLNSAIREAIEESGIYDIFALGTNIFDVDIHEIPENKDKNEPSHLHYDIRYLLQAKNKNFLISSESNDLKWFTFQEIKNSSNEDMIKIINKIPDLYK